MVSSPLLRSTFLPIFFLSMKRTKVVDDESDYFQVDNQWLSEGQRKALKKKEDELREAKYGSRISRGVKVTLDISGREIAEEESKNIGS